MVLCQRLFANALLLPTSLPSLLSSRPLLPPPVSCLPACPCSSPPPCLSLWSSSFSSSFATRRRQLRAMASALLSVSSVAREWHHTSKRQPQRTPIPPSGTTMKTTTARKIRERVAAKLNDALELRGRLFSLVSITSSMPRFKAARNPFCGAQKAADRAEGGGRRKGGKARRQEVGSWTGGGV